MKRRSHIPKDVKRRIFIESGYSCSVRGCTVSSALEFHHIDGNPENNLANNLLVLCSNHHTLATKGMIDRKACREIKRFVSETNINLLNIRSLEPALRQVFREELKRSGFSETPHKETKNVFHSIFDRRYLFDTLKKLRESHEIYFSIRVLGELRYRGSTKVIIDAIEELRNQTPRRYKQKFYYDIYIPAVQSLSKIGTKKALEWIANELFKLETDNPASGFILLMALAGSKNAKRYVGFQVISSKSLQKGQKEVIEKVYNIRGKKYRLRIETKD